MENITVSNSKGENFTAKIDERPDTCPICHHGIVPRFIGAAGGRPHQDDVHFFYQCARDACKAGFIALHRPRQEGRPADYHRLVKVWPRTARPQAYSDEIQAVSSAFVEVHKQALMAEATGLDQVFGISLRKALEFLVKDFASRQAPDDVAKIRKSFLGAVIKSHISDPNVKKCATRATWLGNDEAHYMRVWETHDIEDLKTLIRLTVNWIENVVLTEKYAKEMGDAGAPES